MDSKLLVFLLVSCFAVSTTSAFSFGFSFPSPEDILNSVKEAVLTAVPPLRIVDKVIEGASPEEILETAQKALIASIPGLNIAQKISDGIKQEKSPDEIGLNVLNAKFPNIQHTELAVHIINNDDKESVEEALKSVVYGKYPQAKALLEANSNENFTQAVIRAVGTKLSSSDGVLAKLAGDGIQKINVTTTK